MWAVWGNSWDEPDKMGNTELKGELAKPEGEGNSSRGRARFRGQQFIGAKPDLGRNGTYEWMEPESVGSRL